MDIFRRIFGLHHNEDQSNRSWGVPTVNDRTDGPDNVVPEDPFNRRSFDVFSDPIQMHQYFESQLNEMLKMFGFHGNGEFSIGFPDVHDSWSQTPQQHENESTQNVRDQFLKPGYEKPKTQYSEMVDKDLDDRIKSGDIASVLGEKFNHQITPHEPQISKKNFFYGTSQSMRTIVNPDGSIETHRTMRDNDGNEESTVCHKIGDKEYCVIKKKNKHGQEEVTENYTNMTEQEKDIFTKPRHSPQIQDRTGPSDFPWSKFF
uniref:Uncharacterized protein LOC114341070 n=1 Tax=Diabrotica virgifera virgifera TaxID=50390 RepID=A0A6P7GUW6_DIAVI